MPAWKADDDWEQSHWSNSKSWSGWGARGAASAPKKRPFGVEYRQATEVKEEKEEKGGGGKWGAGAWGGKWDWGDWSSHGWQEKREGEGDRRWHEKVKTEPSSSSKGGAGDGKALPFADYELETGSKLYKCLIRAAYKDPDICAKVEKFAQKAWAATMKSSAEMASEPMPKRVEGFVRDWLEDLLGRAWQSLCSNEEPASRFTAQMAADVFGEFCRWMGMTGFKETWQADPAVVERSCRETFKTYFPEAEASLGSPARSRTSSGPAARSRPRRTPERAKDRASLRPRPGSGSRRSSDRARSSSALSRAVTSRERPQGTGRRSRSRRARSRSRRAFRRPEGLWAAKREARSSSSGRRSKRRPVTLRGPSAPRGETRGKARGEPAPTAAKTGAALMAVKSGPDKEEQDMDVYREIDTALPVEMSASRDVDEADDKELQEMMAAAIEAAIEAAGGVKEEMEDALAVKTEDEPEAATVEDALRILSGAPAAGGLRGCGSAEGCLGGVGAKLYQLGGVAGDGGDGHIFCKVCCEQLRREYPALLGAALTEHVRLPKKRRLAPEPEEAQDDSELEAA